MVGSAFAVITWIEVRPRPRGAFHWPVCSSISRGRGRLQRLHSEAIREQVRMELCAGPQLREGENRRQMEKESCSLEYFPGMASRPKVQCNSIPKYLSSNNYGLSIGLNRVNKTVNFPILVTPGRCFREKKCNWRWI